MKSVEFRADDAVDAGVGRVKTPDRAILVADNLGKSKSWFGVVDHANSPGTKSFSCSCLPDLHRPMGRDRCVPHPTSAVSSTSDRVGFPVRGDTRV